MLLELFRNHKRWLMFIAMVLVIPSFVVTGIYSYNRMISDDGAIAKVDDVSILPQQFDEAKRQRLENLRVRLGEEFRSNMLDSQEAKVALLEAIMNERSLIGETSLEDIHVSEHRNDQDLPALSHRRQIRRREVHQLSGCFRHER